MNKWKAAFFATLTLLITSITLLGYATLDTGISYTYLEASYNEQVQANQVLGNLIVKGGQEYGQKDFLHLLRLTYPKEFIVEEGNKIIMGSNTFVFENDKLAYVR